MARWPIIAVLVLLAVGAPIVAGQVGTYGSVVKYGDADYDIPVTKKTSFSLMVNEADMGVVGEVRDNCVLLDTAGLYDKTFSTGAQGQDIRLTPCDGKAPGTAIGDADAAEKGATYPRVAVTTQFADLNGNSKYDKGEWVYVTTANAGTSTGGFISSRSTGNWTIRLTPVNSYPAGSFVSAGDTDMDAWGAAAKNQTFGLVEREDKRVYIVPLSSGSTLAKSSLVPEKSVRILAMVPDQPTVAPVAMEVLSPELRSGETIKVKVILENTGKLAGWGLAVLKLDGLVLDIKATPVISPTERANVILTSYVPEMEGQFKLQVGDILQFVEVLPSTMEDANSTAAQLSAALDRLAILEARLAELEQDKIVALQQEEVRKNAGAPSAGPVLIALAVLAALLIAVGLRRNNGDDN